MITPVDYNAAKTQLLNAQSDMSQAKYAFIFKTKVLDFYKGLPFSSINNPLITRLIIMKNKKLLKILIPAVILLLIFADYREKGWLVWKSCNCQSGC